MQEAVAGLVEYEVARLAAPQSREEDTIDAIRRVAAAIGSDPVEVARAFLYAAVHSGYSQPLSLIGAMRVREGLA